MANLQESRQRGNLSPEELRAIINFRVETGNNDIRVSKDTLHEIAMGLRNPNEQVED
ncbi:hypothetical protein GYA49_04305 [Candidatus Beckwithbacteria bacterium]|nr:hypothetical protein [Candidatus Beckwithbacteria bacterium]